MEERVFVHHLHRAGNVAMPILQRIRRIAARPKKFLQRRREQFAELRRAVIPFVRDL